MKILKKKNFISSKGADEFLRNASFERPQEVVKLISKPF